MVGAKRGGAESVDAAPDCCAKPMTSASSPRMAGVGVTAMTASNTRAWIAKTIGLLLIVISWASILRSAWRHLGQNRGLCALWELRRKSRVNFVTRGEDLLTTRSV